MNYITSVGVQQVTITIPASSTSATATINAVGSGAFIVWQGTTSSETGNQYDDAMATVTLTNSTTVTATRSVSSANTVTLNAAIIDGDTTNLVKSVQYGTVTIASGSTSGTATVSSVTNANTAILLLGQSASGSRTGLINAMPVISLSGTTVTAAIDSSVSNVLTVSFCVIQFQATALNSSTQNVALSSATNNTSLTSTISSVTTSNAWLAFGGWFGSTNQNDLSQYNARINTATTIVYNSQSSSTATKKFNCVVVEFVSGVLAQSVQRGLISLSAATSNTATITSSSPSTTLVNWVNNNSSLNAAEPAVTSYNITQTNATTLTMSSNASATGAGSYEVFSVHPGLQWVKSSVRMVVNLGDCSPCATLMSSHSCWR